jgi:hypothetical protein
MGKLMDLAAIKGHTVVLTAEEITACKEFTERTINVHLDGGRGNEKKRTDILNGKMAEVGFHKLAKTLFRGISDTNFSSSRYGDGNYDFILRENLSTDVKCHYNDSQRRVFFKPVTGYEIISFVQVDRDTVTYIGSITRGEAIDKMGRLPNSSGNMGFHLSKNLFINSEF